MNKILIFSAGYTAASRIAREKLIEKGLSFSPEPAPDVTHLLLPVPSFEADGRIRGGGVLPHILSDLPESVTVIGGNLRNPALDSYGVTDLLQDPCYVAANAAITADCAIRVAAEHLPSVFQNCPILILGWGRIGKALSFQLRAIGARVSVAARKITDRAMLQALGFGTEDPGRLKHTLAGYRIIFNTVPAPILTAEQLSCCRSDVLKIELASTDGFQAEDTIIARGLPGKMAPEASGALIANTVMRLLAERRLNA